MKIIMLCFVVSALIVSCNYGGDTSSNKKTSSQVVKHTANASESNEKFAEKVKADSGLELKQININELYNKFLLSLTEEDFNHFISSCKRGAGLSDYNGYDYKLYMNKRDLGNDLAVESMFASMICSDGAGAEVFQHDLGSKVLIKFPEKFVKAYAKWHQKISMPQYIILQDEFTDGACTPGKCGSERIKFHSTKLEALERVSFKSNLLSGTKAKIILILEKEIAKLRAKKLD